MANEVREFQVTTTAGHGTATSPVVTSIPLPPGRVVTQVELFVPPGPRGVLGVALAVGGEQALPFEKGTYVVTDDDHVVWPLSSFPTSGAWSVLTYNTGAYAHTIRVLFLVTVPALNAGGAPPQAVIPTSGLVGTVPAGSSTPKPTTTGSTGSTPPPTATAPTTGSTGSIAPPTTTTPSPTPAATASVPVLTLSVISATALTVGIPAQVMIEAYSTSFTTAHPKISVTGTLPAGLSFTTNGDGSATIAGTPTPTDLGTFALTATATQGTAKPVSTTITLSVAPPTPAGTYQTAPTSSVRHYGKVSYYPTYSLTEAVAALNAGQPAWFWTTSLTEPAVISSAAQLLAIEHTGTRAHTQYVTYLASASTAPTAPAPTAPTPEGDWVRAPTFARTVRTYAGVSYTPITTYDQSLSLAATPTTVYLWTQAQGIPSLPQTVASLKAWEHTGTHAYPQFVTYRRS
ncbi:MAG: hypothetical protein ACYCZM_11930 [Acidimicrobiales bacterium]